MDDETVIPMQYYFDELNSSKMALFYIISVLSREKTAENSILCG